MRREAFVVTKPDHRALRSLNYSTAVDALRRARHGTVKLGSAASELGLSYATVFARIDCAPQHGVELLSQSDMFGAEPAGRWIRRDSMKKPAHHEVRRWQILIAGAGTLGENELYGRPVLADQRLLGKYVGQDTLVLGFDEPGSALNLYIYAFLASPSGLKAIRSTSYGTKILRIRTDLLSELPIPLPAPDVVMRVAELIRSAVEERERFARALSAARSIVEDLPEMKEARAMCADRRARCAVWSGKLSSLAAWSVASAGDALAYLRQRWEATLRDLVIDNGIFFGNLRKRLPSSPGHGVELISQRDLHLIRPFPIWIQSPTADPATVFSPPGSIAMAGVGGTGDGDTLGRPVFVDQRLSRYALTQHVLRMIPYAEHSGALHAFLSTVVGRRLVLTTAAGTIVQQLRRDLIAELPAPTLNPVQNRLLSSSHRDAYDSLSRSIGLEDQATRIIEEEVLPQWLA